MERNPKVNNKIIIFIAILFLIQPIIFRNSSSYTKQNFVVNNDTEVFLNIDENTYYNGSIRVTVTEGLGINATVNTQTKEILLGETKEFTIKNTTTIYFTITSVGLTKGYFEIELNIDLESGGNTPIRITIGVLALFLLLLTVVSYYIRTRKLRTKPDEDDEELMDPEVVRRRREAAGAEKRFWGYEKD